MNLKAYLPFGSEQDPSPWAWVKRLTGGVIALLLVAALGFAGFRGYRRWQQQHLISQAKSLIEKGDYSGAALAVRRVLQINRLNLDAARLTAQLLDKGGLRDAILWRSRVAALSPDDPANALELARTALRHNEEAIAGDALAKMPAIGKNSALYHELAGTVSLSQGDSASAIRHFEEALKFEPDNGVRKFQLASAQLFSNDAAVRDPARARLVELAADPALRVPALRAILGDRRTTFTPEQLVGYARELQAAPDATFLDRLLYIEVLRASRHSDYPAELAAMRALAAKGPPRGIFEVISYLNGVGLAADAIAWSREIGAEKLKELPVPIALAESHAAAGDWAAVEQLLSGGEWAELEPLRRAYLARAVRERGDERTSRDHWTAAVKAAADRPQTTMHLVRLASGWGWKDERNEALWSGAGGPSPAWAIEALRQIYTEAGDTRSLLRVATRALDLSPSGVTTRNNFAMLSLLLDSNVHRALGMAWELYAKSPSDPAIVSTYALALHKKERSAEGLALMNTLRSEDLNRPEIAAYYGVLLAANGAPEAAAEYLKKAAPARLLPEEREMVARASAGGG